jgi:hypothetical protein
MNHLLLGGTSIGAVELVQQIPPTTNWIEIIKLAIQGIIAISTIIHFKKSQKN